MSVKLTTPVRRPETFEVPPEVSAECAELEVVAGATAFGFAIELVELLSEGRMGVDGIMAGVDGPEEDGEGSSTTHMRWLLVATSFATVCASVLKGLTWNTGHGSFPSPSRPLSFRMTEMKCVQEDCSSGSELDFVSNRTSTCEMLPMTLAELSSTGNEVMDSWCIN